MFDKKVNILVFTFQVIVRQEHKYQSLYDTYISVSSFPDSSHGGLFYTGSASGGFERRNGNNFLTSTQSQISMSFKIRKVSINRPWLTPAILKYSTLGIQGQKAGFWSSGVLDKANKGIFPLLPTAFIVAKDITVSSNMYSDVAEEALSKISTHSYVRVSGSYSFTVRLIAYTHVLYISEDKLMLYIFF